MEDNAVAQCPLGDETGGDQTAAAQTAAGSQTRARLKNVGRSHGPLDDTANSQQILIAEYQASGGSPDSGPLLEDTSRSERHRTLASNDGSLRMQDASGAQCDRMRPLESCFAADHAPCPQTEEGERRR